MTDLTPVASLDPVVQLETNTLALGGTGNPMNQQAQSLLNRTEFLKNIHDLLAVDVMSLQTFQAALEDKADPAKGAFKIGYKPFGTGSVGRDTKGKLDELGLSVVDFMTDAQRADSLLAAPLLDHTSAFTAWTAALNSTSARLVGRIPSGRRYRSGSFTVPSGVSIKWDSPNLPDMYRAEQSNVSSVLYMLPGSTITMQIGAGWKGGTIFPDGMSFPQTIAQVLSWVDTLFSAPHPGITIENVVIAGFNLAVDNPNTRGQITNCLIDCLNGVSVSNSFDVSKLFKVHCWPYASVGTGNPADTRRTGVGIRIHDTADWAKLTDCFCYGYNRNFQFENVGAVTAVDCSGDNLIGHAASVGFEFLGTTTGEIRLIAPQSAASQRGIVVNGTHTSPTANSIYIENANIWTCATNCIEIDSATDVHIRGGKLRNSPNGVVINNVNASGSITGVQFASDITTNCIQHVASGPNWRIKNNLLQPGGTGRMETATKTINNFASAATFVPDQYLDFMAVTGTTGITAIDATASARGRRILLRFTAGLTVTHSANLVLKGGVSQPVVAGNLMEFAYNGNNIWYEVSRNF